MASINQLGILGLKQATAAQIVRKVEHGLPFSALLRVQQGLSISAEQMAHLLRIPLRTLTRRKQAGRLNMDESERLLRLARIINMADALFEGDHDAAAQWLHTPAAALEGVTPLEMSRTEIGARAVEALIQKLEHGTLV